MSFSQDRSSTTRQSSGTSPYSFHRTLASFHSTPGARSRPGSSPVRPIAWKWSHLGMCAGAQKCHFPRTGSQYPVRVQERVPTHSTVPWHHSTVHQAPGPGRGVLLFDRSRENGHIWACVWSTKSVIFQRTGSQYPVRVQERVPTQSTVSCHHSTVHQAPGLGRGVLLFDRSVFPVRTVYFAPLED